MGALAIQNFYNGRHSNVVATTTWGSYDDALNLVKTFAGKLRTIYADGIGKGYTVNNRASELDAVNYFHVACYLACDGIYKGDTRTQAFLHSISKTDEHRGELELTDGKLAFAWSEYDQDMLMIDAEDRHSLGVYIDWCVENGAINFDKTTVNFELCHEYESKDDWMWERDRSDADYEELPEVEGDYKAVPLRQILANAFYQYYEWRTTSGKRRVAHQK